MTEPRIHPSAAVAAEAVLGEGVRVGPLALIEAGVEIGPGCVVDIGAVICGGTRLGAGNRVHPYAVLGGPPQDLGFDPRQPSRLQVGDDNVFREGVTVNRATDATGVTMIGSGGYFMNGCHIAHDCRVGDKVVIANNVALGGHVELGEGVFLGGGAMIHQFCRIGALSIVSGLAAVRKDVLPYSMTAGNPARHFRVNLIGLRRAGIDGARLRAISQAFRRLRQGDRELAGLAGDDIERLRAWLAAPSSRGLCGFARADGR